jgi:hypothetical protein
MAKQYIKTPNNQDNNRKKPQKNIQQTPKEQPTKVKITEPKDLLSVLDSFFEKHLPKVFFISIILTVLFGILLFDVKVSEGGDDSSYIIRAYEFVHSLKYPSFQGPLYPFVLSPFILFFGIKLILLKSISYLFIIVHLIFFYKSFRNKVSSTLLAFTLLMLSFNSAILYFASQTYNEAFFMCLQMVFFFFFFKYFISTDTNKLSLKDSYRKYLTVGLMLFLLGLCKNIGLASIFAVILFFALFKQWKALLYNILSFSGFFILFEAIKRIVWGKMSAQFSSQSNVLMLKDYYDPTKGTEDLMGFVQRFIDNSNLYFSKHFYMIFGIRPELDTTISVPLTIFTYLLLISTFVLIFRKNKYLIFTGLYIGIMCATSFIILQKDWDQQRLILIYCPLILLFILCGVYEMFRTHSLRKLQFVFVILMLILLSPNLGRTTDKVKDNREILSKNLTGDITYGLTPDWVNFIRMSQWVTKNIPDSLVVGSRKPTISSIYGNGRYFYGIYKFLTLDADTLLEHLTQRKSKILIISGSEWQNKNMDESLMRIFRSLNIGMIQQKSGVDFIYDYSKTDSTIVFSALHQLKINYKTDVKAYQGELKNSKSDYFLADPDYLVKYLKSNKIRYLMLASLRRNSREKSEYIIDTVHRYVYYIQMKYPGMFRQVFQIGENDDEPTSIVEVLY